MAVSNPDIDNQYKKVLSEQKRWTKATKQIATLGPASNNEEMIEKLFLAGMEITDARKKIHYIRYMCITCPFS